MSETVSKQSISETVSRLFRTLFGPQGRKTPGYTLETLSGFRARRAQETPVKGRVGLRDESVLSRVSALNLIRLPDCQNLSLTPGHPGP